MGHIKLKAKVQGGINFSNILYLTKYILNIIISTGNQYKNWDIFFFFFTAFETQYNLYLQPISIHTSHLLWERENEWGESRVWNINRD